MIVINAYYCTTPTDSRRTIDVLVNWCRENNQVINFNNPWTEQRLSEQETLAPYVRQHVLDYWVDYMTENGFPIEGIKENWLRKHVKKHSFIGGSQRF
jgi:phage/plasmid-associated DNA primase